MDIYSPRTPAAWITKGVGRHRTLLTATVYEDLLCKAIPMPRNSAIMLERRMSSKGD